MARGSGQRAERASRAIEAGMAATGRAHENLMRQQNIGQDRLLQEGARSAQTYQEHARFEESKRQFDESAAARERELEAARELEREQMAARQQEVQATRAFQAEQAEADRELTAARSGLVRGDNPRAQALQAEMDRGAQQTGARNLDDPQVRQGMAAQVRGQGPGPLDPQEQRNLRDQTGRGMELDRGGRRWVPSPESRQAQQFDREKEAFKLETERMKTLAYKQQIAASIRKAEIRGDAEAKEQEAHRFNQMIISDVNLLDRMQKGEPGATDWSSIAKAAKEEGNYFVDPALRQSIDSKMWDERVRTFWSSKISKLGLESIAYTGWIPDVKKTGLDMSSVPMQDFAAAASAGRAAASMLPPGALNFNSMQERNEFLNKYAALQALGGLMRNRAAQQQASAGAGAAGMIPSMGMQQQGPQPMADQQLGQQRYAEQEAAVGQGGPQRHEPTKLLMDAYQPASGFPMQ